MNSRTRVLATRECGVGTIEKAIDVLFHLHGADAPPGVTEIARALEMPKSSTHRVLAALLDRGLVERDDGGRYRPGLALVALGLGVLQSEPVVMVARPVLESFAEEIGETFFLVSARAGALVVLEKAEGRGFLRAAPRVGSTLPIHATAVGKLYLAYAPEQVALPAQGVLASFTADTLTDRRALEAELDGVRADGFARNQDEWIPGLSVLAAPVLLGDRLVGCIALAAATPRLRELDDARLPGRVLEAASKVTAGLAGSAVASSHRRSS